MTKIKNTKKGMAKKTLSMSLVVAMLATSNVPVWAAEFSDGTDAAVTSEADAPVVDTVNEFSDTEAEAPVVADDTTDVPAAQVAEGYTVNTNMELKDGDWATALDFAKKDSVADTDTAKFEILDSNTVPVSATKIEVYSGTSLIDTQTVNGNTVADLVSAIKAVKKNKVNDVDKDGVGIDAYKNSKQVTVKVYVANNDTPVYETSATVNPVDISSKKNGTWTVAPTTPSANYNGKIQTPTVTVTNAAYPTDADVVVKFDDEKDAKNADTYTFSVEGVEASGYAGTIAGGTYTINTINPTKDSVSVAISGTATYNGDKTQPTVVVTDKLTNTVIPSSLYTVTVTDKTSGTYDKNNITVTMKANNGKEGTELVKNNFTANEKIPKDCFTGNFVVSALDLSKLGEKYDISVAAKKVGENVTKDDIIFVDKATKKTVKYDDVIPSSTKLSATNSTTIVTSDNTVVGTGKVTIKATNVNDTQIVGEYTTTFNVVNATITAADVSFAKGTKINNKTYSVKTALGTKSTDATTGKEIIVDNTDITAELSKIVYTGSAIEPLKEAFSNLVLTNSATVTDQKLILGTDYDLVYENNTDSNYVSKKVPTIKLVFKGNYSGTISYKFNIDRAVAKVEAADLEYVPGKNSYDIVAKVTVDGKDVPTSAYTVTTTSKATSAVNANNEAEGVVVFENKNYKIKDVVVDEDDENNRVTDITKVTYVGGITKDGRYCIRIKTALTGRKLSNCTATVEGNYVYTGEAISPKLVVKDGNTTLVEGVDYTIVSKTGTNAGAAHVTIQGKGNYKGTLTVDYTIAKANLANAVVESSKDKKADKSNYDTPYTGLAVDPDIATVKIGNKVLTEYDPITKKGDYTIKWDDAVEVGTYNFTITALAGSQNVEGEYKGTFKVTPNKLTAHFATKVGNKAVTNGDTLDKSLTGVSYTGSAITIDSFKTKYVLVDGVTGKTLTEGKDYELVYTDNVNAGKAKVVAYGLGNHAQLDDKGKKQNIASMEFYIEGKATITENWVQKISDVEYAGGLAVEPTVVVVNPTTKERLTQGKDYTVTTEVTKVSEDGKPPYDQGDVTIKGLGAYTTTDFSNTKISFSKTLNWKVTKKDFANTTISVDKYNNVTVVNGSVVVPSSEYDVKFSEDGKKVTVTAKADNKNYTGSKELAIDVAKVGAPMISDVKVVGNKATVILSGDAEGASGYDYVISTDRDCITNKNYDSISKNQVQTSTTFKYVQKGVYYAYCHAWTRDENGKKVFGEWSNAYPFSVTAITPDAPVITNVKVSGSTIKVTYKAAANATGYDVVLGTSSKKENGETRPYNYGAHKVLNLKEGTVTATFKNVPAGKWTVGMHAFNRTSEDGKKVFSPWSNLKTATVK